MEKEIINKMSFVMNTFLKAMKELRDIKNEIDNDVLKLDNNFCLENQVYKDFNVIFDINAINGIIDIVEPVISSIEYCEHDYIDDRVETGVESYMTTISYCKNCNITKKL